MTGHVVDFPKRRRPSRRGFIGIGAAASAVVAGITPTAIATGDGIDPVLQLIADEDRWRTLAVAARAKAEDAWWALSGHVGRAGPWADERTQPLYAETVRLEDIAGELYDRIEITRATTIEGAIAQLEFLIGDAVDVSIVIAGLRQTIAAKGGAA